MYSVIIKVVLLHCVYQFGGKAELQSHQIRCISHYVKGPNRVCYEYSETDCPNSAKYIPLDCRVISSYVAKVCKVWTCPPAKEQIVKITPTTASTTLTTATTITTTITFTEATTTLTTNKKSTTTVATTVNIPLTAQHDLSELSQRTKSDIGEGIFIAIIILLIIVFLILWALLKFCGSCLEYCCASCLEYCCGRQHQNVDTPNSNNTESQQTDSSNTSSSTSASRVGELQRKENYRQHTSSELGSEDEDESLVRRRIPIKSKAYRSPVNIDELLVSFSELQMNNEEQESCVLTSRPQSSTTLTLPTTTSSTTMTSSATCESKASALTSTLMTESNNPTSTSSFSHGWLKTLQNNAQKVRGFRPTKESENYEKSHSDACESVNSKSSENESSKTEGTSSVSKATVGDYSDGINQSSDIFNRPAVIGGIQFASSSFNFWDDKTECEWGTLRRPRLCNDVEIVTIDDVDLIDITHDTTEQIQVVADIHCKNVEIEDDCVSFMSAKENQEHEEHEEHVIQLTGRNNDAKSSETENSTHRIRPNVEDMKILVSATNDEREVHHYLPNQAQQNDDDLKQRCSYKQPLGLHPEIERQSVPEDVSSSLPNSSQGLTYIKFDNDKKDATFVPKRSLEVSQLQCKSLRKTKGRAQFFGERFYFT